MKSAVVFMAFLGCFAFKDPLAKEMVYGAVPGFFSYPILNQKVQLITAKDQLNQDIKRSSRELETTILDNINSFQGLSELVNQAEFKFKNLEERLVSKVAELETKATEKVANDRRLTANKITVISSKTRKLNIGN